MRSCRVLVGVGRGGKVSALLGVLGALIVAAAAGEGSAGAAAMPRGLEVTLQDDALLLYRSRRQVRRTARRIAAIGADRVRLTASWSALAPDPDSRHRPRFDATNPSRYRREGIRRLDTAVSEAAAAGLSVQIDLAFWAPRWAVARTLSGDRQRWRPSSREYGRFALALARRYSGRARDPARRGRRLPAVRLWTTWNEPNHPGFLLPQWSRVGGGWRPEAPHVYRRLHEVAFRALKRVDERNRVLLGGLAATGGTRPGYRRGLPPLRFVRELACVDRSLTPLRARRCRGFRPLRADGFAHHPYSLAQPPGSPQPRPDSVALAELDALASLLRELRARGRIETELPLYVTEYGYESNPPDFARGVAPRTQARYLGLATYLAWKQPDTRMFAQFLLQDIGPDRRYGTRSARRWHDYQTGLYYHDGRPKPALQAFRLPFWIEPRGFGVEPELTIFGQVRPGAGSQRVTIERRAGDGSWEGVASRERDPLDACCSLASVEFDTDAEGFYLRTVPNTGGGSYRARWLLPDGRSRTSISLKSP